MGIKILQANIQSWASNRYTLLCSLSESNPDIILLNEISIPKDVKPKINGYDCYFNCQERFTGYAIFVKYSIKHFFFDLNNDNIGAVKIFTNVGPLIVSTAYIPPRFNCIPSLEINKILNYQLPSLFISDFNAHHPHFQNCSSNNKKPDSRGNQLMTIINSRKLSYLGPDFYTLQIWR